MAVASARLDEVLGVALTAVLLLAEVTAGAEALGALLATLLGAVADTLPVVLVLGLGACAGLDAGLGAALDGVGAGNGALLLDGFELGVGDGALLVDGVALEGDGGVDVDDGAVDDGVVTVEDGAVALTLPVVFEEVLEDAALVLAGVVLVTLLMLAALSLKMPFTFTSCPTCAFRSSLLLISIPSGYFEFFSRNLPLASPMHPFRVSDLASSFFAFSFFASLVSADEPLVVVLRSVLLDWSLLAFVELVVDVVGVVFMSSCFDDGAVVVWAIIVADRLSAAAHSSIFFIGVSSQFI